MSAEQMKQTVARAAVKYVTDDSVIGVGTGSTANHFIDALAESQIPVRATVAVHCRRQQTGKHPG